MIHHLAIQSSDLDKSVEFYKSLGGFVGRRYLTHAVMDFYGLQLVCHLAKPDDEPTMYPRHFGIIYDTMAELKFNWMIVEAKDIVFAPYFIRHEGNEEEHHTFFLKDPSNNVIEFKWYKSRDKVFGP